MGQRVVIDANNNVRIIETGPIGPTGLGGSDNEIAYGHAYYPADLEVPSVCGITLDDLLHAPNPTQEGQRVFVLGHGSAEGVWLGHSSPSTPDSFDDDVPLTKSSASIPTKMMIVDVIPGPNIWTSGELLPGPWMILKNAVTGEWNQPVKIGGGSSGTYLLDLRGETALPYPPAVGSGSSGSGLELPSEIIGSGLPIQYFGVDFSELPDDVDTFVVLLRNGRWGLVPTGWPETTRGSWTLNVAFESYNPEANLVEMGTTVEELTTWGFMPTDIDVVVEYHTTWGG